MADQSIIDALFGGPSWLERANQERLKAQAAYLQGGPAAMMQDTSGIQGLAGGFGGTTTGKLTTQQLGMMDRALKVAKENGIEITPENNLVLYHGTRNKDAIQRSDILKLGSYLATNEKTAKEYGPNVLKVEVPPYTVFDSGKEGDIYFSLNENVPFKEAE